MSRATDHLCFPADESVLPPPFPLSSPIPVYPRHRLPKSPSLPDAHPCPYTCHAFSLNAPFVGSTLVTLNGLSSFFSRQPPTLGASFLIASLTHSVSHYSDRFFSPRLHDRYKNLR